MFKNLFVFCFLTIILCASTALCQQDSEYYVDWEPTDQNMSILVLNLTINNRVAPEGFEIGVFTSRGQLAGACIWNGDNDQPVGLAAWGGDDEE